MNKRSALFIIALSIDVSSLATSIGSVLSWAALVSNN